MGIVSQHTGMSTIRLNSIFSQRALVTRASAHKVEPAIRDAADAVIEVDFEGIEAIAPSFVDELLKILLTGRQPRVSPIQEVVFSNVPTELSLKFSRIASSYGRSIDQEPDGSWTFFLPAA